MSHVYVAYHPEDEAFAADLIHQVQDAGFEVWADRTRQRRDTEQWRAAIDQAIRNAFVMLVIVTPAARRSEQLNYEWMFALGTDIPVVPVVFKPGDLHPRLHNLESVDFTNKHAQPWGKLLRLIHEAEDEEINREINERIARRREAEPPPQRPSRFGAPESSSGERLSPIERLRRAQRTLNDDPFGPMFPRSKDGKPPLEKLLVALTSDDRDRRIRAASELGDTGDRTVIPVLIKTLRDDDWRVREAAAGALARLKAAAAVPALLEALRQMRGGPFSNNAPNKLITQAIRDIGAASVPVLIDAINDDDPRMRLAIVDMLGEIGDTDAIPVLTNALHDPDVRVRWRAAEALGSMGSEAALPHLLAMLKEGSEDARLSATWALGQIGSQAAVDGLIALLHHREWRLRWAAVEALWAIGADAVPALIDQLNDRSEIVRSAAARALAEIRQPAIEPLIAVLSGSLWDARWSAAAALVDIGADAVPALIAALDAPNWQVAWAAADTLKRIGTPEALDAAQSWQEHCDSGAGRGPHSEAEPDTGGG